MVRTTEAPDPELGKSDGRLGPLQFGYVSHRERPNGKGHERTELEERTFTNREDAGWGGTIGVQLDGQPIRSLLWIERKHRDMQVARWRPMNVKTA